MIREPLGEHLETLRHTPGPWEIREAGAWSEGFPEIRATDPVPGEGSEPLAWVTSHSEADARLIAAAPDLLAAARQAVTSMDSGSLEDGYVAEDALRAAIEKATGRP